MSLNRAAIFVNKTPELKELTSLMLVFAYNENIMNAASQAQATPALITVKNNHSLPSYENLENKKMDISVVTSKDPLKGLFLSLAHLAKAHNKADWIGGLGIMPLLNIAQIAITTIFEFGIRTLGALFLQPARKLNEIIDSKKKLNPGVKFGLKTLVNTLTSPLWCIGQTFSLAGDVLAYSRQFFDSFRLIINPVKIMEWKKNKTNIPSLKTVVTTFVSSALKLLPTIGLIIAAVLTAGFSTPIQAALISAGSAAAKAGLVFAGIYLSGAITTVSKMFSGMVNGATRELTADKKKTKEEAVLEHSRKESLRAIELSQIRHNRISSSHGIVRGTMKDEKPSTPDEPKTEKPIIPRIKIERVEFPESPKDGSKKEESSVSTPELSKLSVLSIPSRNRSNSLSRSELPSSGSQTPRLSGRESHHENRGRAKSF